MFSQLISATALLCLTGSVFARIPQRDTLALNITQEFYLQTIIVPGQERGKYRFDLLYAAPYNIGTNQNDIIFPFDVDLATSITFYKLDSGRLDADLGHKFPYGAMPQPAASPDIWRRSVQLDGGNGHLGFFFNDTGLQWRSDEVSFGGWMGM